VDVLVVLEARTLAIPLVVGVLAGKAAKSLPPVVGPVVKAAVLPPKSPAMMLAPPVVVLNGLGSVATVPIQKPVMLALVWPKSDPRSATAVKLPANRPVGPPLVALNFSMSLAAPVKPGTVKLPPVDMKRVGRLGIELLGMKKRASTFSAVGSFKPCAEPTNIRLNVPEVEVPKPVGVKARTSCGLAVMPLLVMARPLVDNRILLGKADVGVA